MKRSSKTGVWPATLLGRAAQTADGDENLLLRNRTKGSPSKSREPFVPGALNILARMQGSAYCCSSSREFPRPNPLCRPKETLPRWIQSGIEGGHVFPNANRRPYVGRPWTSDVWAVPRQQIDLMPTPQAPFRAAVSNSSLTYTTGGFLGST